MSAPERPVLVVDDEPRILELYAHTLRDAGIATLTAGSAEEALALMARTQPAMVISDVRMPGQDGLTFLRTVRGTLADLPFLLVTAFADVRDAVAALRLGAVDYLAKPVDLDELVACVQDTLGLGAPFLPPEVPAELLTDLVAAGPAMQTLLQDALRVARSDATVLITGETGTGKEVLARFIHAASTRRLQPLVAVNCAAIPAALLAGELFGHERGAFTGATEARPGRFREAAGGTLLLDEIGDMPLELQPVLLRILETRRVTPLGARSEVPVDLRIVAATHRHLPTEVEAGRFRADLYYRLNVIELEIPPLRERPEDILPLARLFLARRDEPRRLSRAAAEILLGHAWPGNVRELANAMERARLLARAELILPEHLPRAVRHDRPLPAELRPLLGDATRPLPTLEEVEISSLQAALAHTDGNRTHAARLLGISRRGLIKKLRRFGLSDDPE